MNGKLIQAAVAAYKTKCQTEWAETARRNATADCELSARRQMVKHMTLKRLLDLGIVSDESEISWSIYGARADGILFEAESCIDYRLRLKEINGVAAWRESHNWVMIDSLADIGKWLVEHDKTDVPLPDLLDDDIAELNRLSQWPKIAPSDMRDVLASIKSKITDPVFLDHLRGWEYVRWDRLQGWYGFSVIPEDIDDLLRFLENEMRKMGL